MTAKEPVMLDQRYTKAFWLEKVLIQMLHRSSQEENSVSKVEMCAIFNKLIEKESEKEKNLRR